MISRKSADRQCLPLCQTKLPYQSNIKRPWAVPASQDLPGDAFSDRIIWSDHQSSLLFSGLTQKCHLGALDMGDLVIRALMTLRCVKQQQGPEYIPFHNLHLCVHSQVRPAEAAPSTFDCFFLDNTPERLSTKSYHPIISSCTRPWRRIMSYSSPGSSLHPLSSHILTTAVRPMRKKAP